MTISKSHGLWLFIAGHNDLNAADDDEMALVVVDTKSANLGNTFLKIDDKGLAHGSLVFKGLLIPWRCGRYEIRYHHIGGYSVLCCSESFEVSALRFILNPHLESRQGKLEAVKQRLLVLVENCLDLSGVCSESTKSAWRKVKFNDDIVDHYRERIGSVDAGTECMQFFYIYFKFSLF